MSSKSTFISAHELLRNEIKEMPMLVDGLFPKVGLACLAGSSDTGKSSLLRQLGIQVCNGDNTFLGHKLSVTHKSAIYVSTEDDHHALSFLLQKQYALQENIESSDRFFFLCGFENLVDELDSKLSVTPCDLVVVDAAADVIAGNFNNSDVIRAALNSYSKVALKHECLILFLHHIGKSHSQSAPSKNSLVGSQSFEAKMRSVVILSNKVKSNKMSHRSISIVKGNYIKDELKNKEQVVDFTENMLFEVVEEGVINKVKLAGNELITEVVKLKDELSCRDIAMHLSKKGYKIGKSKVHNIIKSAEG